MNDLPAEDLIFDFLEEKINAAQNGDVLFELELHDTVYKKIKTNRGVRIGSGESDLLINSSNEIQEFDAEVVLVFYSEIKGADKTERRAARKDVWEIAKAIAGVFIADDSMGNRVCRSRCLTAGRGFESFNSKPYAVINMPVIVNETGEIDFRRRRY